MIHDANKEVELGLVVKEVQDVQAEHEDVDEWREVILDVLAILDVDEVV